MKRLQKITILFVLFVAYATPVAAAPAPQGSPSTIEGFLVWLIAGGSVIAVSWVFEQMAWFQALTSQKKRIVQYVASASIGMAALAVQLYVPASTLEALAPFFAVLASTFGMIFLNQAAHSLDPARK